MGMETPKYNIFILTSSIERCAIGFGVHDAYFSIMCLTILNQCKKCLGNIFSNDKSLGWNCSILLVRTAYNFDIGLSLVTITAFNPLKFIYLKIENFEKTCK